MTTFIIVIALIAVVYLIFKYKISMSKPADKRTAVEKIMATVGVAHRQGLEEAAEKIRTPEISRAEGIQKCTDAIRQLERDYESELKSLILKRDTLSENMSKLEATPNQHLEKAKENKRKMQEALDRGENELAETYKQSAYMYLDLKEKAQQRVERSKKFLKDIKVIIEKSNIQYEMKKATLDELLQEFESMQGNISAAKFNDSLDIIKSLRKETTDKLRAQNAEIEAAEKVRGGEYGTSTDSVPIGKYNDEFENL